jgi:putative restriction endonuclease
VDRIGTLPTAPRDDLPDILDSMFGTPDLPIRRAVFDWLSEQREVYGEALPRTILADFRLGERAIPLVGPTGIWKPAACELPISITTTAGGPYFDAFDEAGGTLVYSYRGTDPMHRDNVGLRRALQEHVPLVYFYALEPGYYAAAYPAFVVRDQPVELKFTFQIDDLLAGLAAAIAPQNRIAEERDDIRRGSITRTVRQRLHQVAFRQRVIRAYETRCALCSLRHQELLDAAHITPDTEAEGEPVVSNGVSLCKLHHAAFDRLFFAIRPDYRIEVRPTVLAEIDGPMLVVGLQEIHGRLLRLPRRTADRPDPRRLERRYEEFLRAG